MVLRHEYVGRDFKNIDIIWKYYTLPDFLCLLQTKKLYFTQVDTFSDPNEFPITEIDAELFDFSIDEYKTEIARIKKKSYASCWHISEHESFGLWNSYSDIKTGVAIQSTAIALMDSINTCMTQVNDREITIGKVYYINEKKGFTQIDGWRKNILYTQFTKTKPYENENELRLLFELREPSNEKAIGVDVSLNELIKEIIIAPSAKLHHTRAITNIIRAYKIQADIIQSNVK